MQSSPGARQIGIDAGFVVDHMMLTAAAVLEVPPGRRAAHRRVLDVAAKRLRLIVLGSRAWAEYPG